MITQTWAIYPACHMYYHLSICKQKAAAPSQCCFWRSVWFMSITIRTEVLQTTLSQECNNLDALKLYCASVPRSSVITITPTIVSHHKPFILVRRSMCLQSSMNTKSHHLLFFRINQQICQHYHQQQQTQQTHYSS